MRLARSGLPVALIVGALALSAPSALAADGSADWDAAAAGAATTVDAAGTVRINPRKAFPGSTVTVSTTACGKETYGKGESELAGQFHLLPGERKGVLVGEFRVPENAASGTDTVTLKCPPRIKQTVTYHISGRPHGAVEAGFGWAAGAEESDGNGAQLALGALLLGGAVAGGVARLRRRSSRAGTSA
ncbi:sortase [Streptomyces sp. NPDC093111]|uniref:sortase n=1 Tax=Streptomyces sp. NPDC093111 TaxID=3154978 RepID=UPI003418F5F8